MASGDRFPGSFPPLNVNHCSPDFEKKDFEIPIKRFKYTEFDGVTFTEIYPLSGIFFFCFS